MRKLFLSLLILFFSNYLFSQADDSIMIRHIADEILLHAKAYDNLHDLTKNIGGRLSGSPQMYKAEQWGFKTLQSTGADKVWLQECMVPHWVRGGKDEAVAYMASKKKDLDVIALGNSIGTGAKGVKADVMEVATFDDLEKKKDQVKGKIVFYNYKFNPTFINTFEAYGDAVRYRECRPKQGGKIWSGGCNCKKYESQH